MIKYSLAMLPYLEQPYAYESCEHVREYISPADFTVVQSDDPSFRWQTSYAANCYVFDSVKHFPQVASDGTSNSIMFSEHYHVCGSKKIVSGVGALFVVFPFTARHYDINTHRPSFADGGPMFGGKNPGDVYPITEGNPATTRPSRPGVTFQVRPTQVECDPSLPQTPHPGGMLTALCDGSVRVVSPQVSPSAFWSAVTPAGGEVQGDW